MKLMDLLFGRRPTAEDSAEALSEREQHARQREAALALIREKNRVINEIRQIERVARGHK